MSQFDWDMDVDELGAISILMFDTAEPDVAVLSKKSDVDVVAEIGEQFGEAEYLQLIVINRDEDTSEMCPYFRIIMDTFTATDRVNYNLQLFYKRIGMSSLNACCNKAMVVGLYDLVEMGRCISVPTKFSISSMDPEDMGLPKELDTVCLKPCATTLYNPGATLYDIAERTPHSSAHRLCLQCSHCIDNRRRCDKKFPCSQCTKNGQECVYKLEEVYKRVADIDKRVRNRELMLDELALYILNAEAVRNRQRKYLKRDDQLGVLQRMRAMYPLLDDSEIPKTHLDHLPENMDDLIEEHEIWKVEWFYRGINVFVESATWQEKFSYPKGRTSWKLTDMAGFCRWHSLIQLWSDSLVYPDQEVYYEGLAVHKGLSAPVMQKARVMSHIYDHDHVITVIGIKDQ